MVLLKGSVKWINQTKSSNLNVLKSLSLNTLYMIGILESIIFLFI